MAVSIISVQRDIILDTIQNTAPGEWKVFVNDESSKKLMDNVIKEDDILNHNITNIEQIEHKRTPNPDMDAIYFLSPQPHIVDCLMADFERRRYRRAFLIWTALLPPQLKARLDKSREAASSIAQFKILNIDYFPRESHLITFRDPWSFPILFHPACNNLVRRHMDELAQKIVSVCVSLGEYPVIRYYRPANPTHEASVLCSHLARFVQEELDQYAQYHEDFPPRSNRPRGALFITDRSMDLYSPLLHEFTYQAMVHDLLPIKEGDKVLYRTTMNQGEPTEQEKDMEIGEKDKIWVENRHRHMKDTIEKLMSDFRKFIEDNPHFANTNSENASSINAIKDMLAGLPQFQELKDAYTLHLNMAQDAMDTFQRKKLADIAGVEQCLATGLDEEGKKAKNMADQVVRSLDDENVGPPDRLRLIILYLLYREGLVAGDIDKLLAHAALPPQDGEVIRNLDLLGATVAKPLKDKRAPSTPLFPRRQASGPIEEGYSLSRYKPAVQLMLEEYAKGTLDQMTFPFTKPHLDAADGLAGQESLSQTSLRSAKPSWARTRPSAAEPRQRIIVFSAGGATYSEIRACYEVSRATQKDIFLATSHMLTPGLYLRQVGDLSVDKRRLDIPAERPKPQAPAHLFEKEKPSQPPAGSSKPPLKSPAPPTAAMNQMSLNGTRPSNGPASGASRPTAPPQTGPIKLGKEPEKKKKHHFFSSKK